jgi:hypothetical protein
MSAEQQDFEKLSRMLKLKRHEQPHPRYFNDFSSQVIQRIQAGDAATVRQNWIERLWEHFAARPAYTGMIATAACALLVTGMIYAEQGSPAVADAALMNSPAIAASGGSLQPVSLFGAVTNPLSAGHSTAIAPGDSLFNFVPQLNEQKVSWPGGGK